MIPRHPQILNRNNTVLVAVDLQEPFLRNIHDRERVIKNCTLLIKAALTLSVPVLMTLQYADRMGGLVPEIAELFEDNLPPAYDKLIFSCCGNEDFNQAVAKDGRRQVLLCGVESHICVTQTALDLIHRGHQPHVAVDAVSSRSAECYKLGIDKMTATGVTPCSSEGAVYELLYSATAPEFKAILSLVK
jgi:nicotinamidase-related amidase